MRSPPVLWYEGLFLRPQHFQALERHWAGQAQMAHQWDAPYHYGLHAIEFSRDALANHHFEASRLMARMRDGTLVSFDLGEELDRVDLKEAVKEAEIATVSLEDAFERESVIRLYVGVPKLRLGRANLDNGTANGDSRFLESRQVVHDENRSNSEQEVQFRTLNVKILNSTQDLSGYELLPIAQIRRAGDQEAAPQLDEDYIPPVLSIDAWPGLGRGIVRELYDIIGQKIEVLSLQIQNRGIGRDNRDAGDADRMAMLERLNEGYATLSVLTFARGIHPLTAYTELCRLAGQLAIFTRDRRMEDIPAYDHEDLARIFKFIRRWIEDAIHGVRDYEYQQRYFLGVGMGMQVTLEPRWFNSDWQWFIGVKKGDLSEKECRDLLSSGQLDWKLGSARQVEILFKRRAEGLQLRPVDRSVRALPARQDWIYYEVLQNESAAWRDVYETQTLAMRLRDSLILNLDRLQGEQQLVVSALGKKVALQFALFAIPTIS